MARKILDQLRQGGTDFPDFLPPPDEN